MDCAPVGGPLNPPAVSRRATRTIMPVSPPQHENGHRAEHPQQGNALPCIAWRRDHPRSLTAAAPLA